MSDRKPIVVSSRAALATLAGASSARYALTLDSGSRVFRWVPDSVATEDGQRTVVAGTGGGASGAWIANREDVRGDDITASATVAVGDGAWRRITSLSAAAVVTLSTTNAVAGDTVTLTRVDESDYDVTVVNDGPAAGTVATMPSGRAWWASFGFDGSNWLVQAGGAIDEGTATTALLELRDTIIEYVWGRAGLPAKYPTTVTDPSSSVGTPQASWPTDCVRMTEFSCTLPRAGSYTSRLAHPALLPAYQGGAGRRNELVIVMGGHSANWMSGNAAYLTLGLLRYGYHVAACDMPMYDLNASHSSFTSLLGSAITITNNHDMSALETDGINGLRIFLDGHLHVINYCMDVLGFRRVRLVGLSGGGWSGEWLGAVDPRITAVHSVMGSLPFSMRQPGSADWEQLPARGFWAAAGGLEENVYKLACLEEGRRLVKYCGDLEPVFPTASLRSQLATMESDIAESVNGSFALSFNTSTTVHDYTVGTGTLDQIIQSTNGFVGQILSNLNAS